MVGCGRTRKLSVNFMCCVDRLNPQLFSDLPAPAASGCHRHDWQVAASEAGHAPATGTDRVVHCSVYAGESTSVIRCHACIQSPPDGGLNEYRLSAFI